MAPELAQSACAAVDGMSAGTLIADGGMPSAQEETEPVNTTGGLLLRDGKAPEPGRKSKPSTIREFEAALHEQLGFSKREARAIAAQGFKSASPVDDAESVSRQLEELAGVIRRNAAHFNT